jgi:hypothetical protein
MLDMGSYQNGIDAIICESFQYRPHLPKANLTPVEVIGVVKEWCRQNSVKYFPQTPAMGKGFYTDDRLKERQLYKVGKPHANDAMRHLMFFMNFNKRRGEVMPTSKTP